jgi:hypothetical protein
MSTDASAHTPMPVPDGIGTPAEFIEAMRALRDWVGLTYRQLEDRAMALGEKLPRSTISTALSRGSLPREATIATFVKACGGDRRVVDAWIDARRRIAEQDNDIDDLAAAVESWLVSRMTEPVQPREETLTLDGSSTFSEGRLARAVAESTTDRWVGLHRKTRRGGAIRLLLRRQGS